MKRRDWNLMKRPHPFIFKPSSVLIAGGITFIILFALNPFNAASLNLMNRLLFALISGSIASACVWLVVTGLKWGFPRWTAPEKWTVGKEILLIISVVLVIALMHFLWFSFQSSHANVLELFLMVVFRTLLISILPIICLVLYEQYHHRTQQLKRALEISKFIRSMQYERNVEAGNSLQDTKQSQDAAQIWFSNENEKPVCQLYLSNIQFIKAEGNYIEVFFLNEQKILKKNLIRNKLSYATSILPPQDFWRVHRSFIVQLNHVEKVIGNARNLELIMKTSQITVPVSRSKANDLLSHLTNRSRSAQIAPNRTERQ